LLCEIRFGAYLQYSPRGQGEISQRSRRWRDAVKHDTPGSLERVAERLAEDEAARAAGVIDILENAILIPAPRSAPLRRGALWPAHRICEELARAGLGRDILPCLERAEAVRKSAFAAKGERPGVRDHLDSMSVAAGLAPAGDLVVVDDFVTKGATLLASGSLVKAAFPTSTVSGFALVRTMGFVPEVDTVVEPCVGRIWLSAGGTVHRRP
jgi:hypothetical protein